MSALRTYPSKFDGQVLLVCRKCQKKLKGERTAAAKLKKSLKRIGRRDPDPVHFHLIAVGCMKLCPRGAVAVCSQAGMRQAPAGLSIVRTKEDVLALYEDARPYSSSTDPPLRT